jgi:hypothetical protein
MSVLRILVDNDHFGGSFQMTVDGQDRTKTMFGFLFTLMFYGLMGMGIFTFGKDYLDTSKPQTVQKEIQNSTVPTIKMNDDSGIYYFYLVKGPAGYISHPNVMTYMNFSIRYDTLSLNTNGTINRNGLFIPSQPCNTTSWFSKMIKHVSPRMQPIFQQYGMCADDNYKNVTFYGALAPPYSAFTAGFGLCTMGTGCKSQAELAQFTLSAYSIEAHYDQESVTNPLYLHEKLQVAFQFQPGYFLQQRSIIADLQVATDTGRFSRSFEYQKGFQHVPPRFERRKLYSNDLFFAEFTVYSSGTHREYNRTYYKLLDLCSDFGGLIQIVAFIITIFYADYNRYVQTVSLIRYGVLGKRKLPPLTNLQKTQPISTSVKPDPVAAPRSTKLELSEVNVAEPKNPEAPTHDFMAIRGKNRKPTFTDYSQSRTNKLFNPDDFEMDNPLKLTLIKKRILSSNDELTNKQAELYSLASKRLEHLSDAYTTCDSFNNYNNLKDILMDKEHRVLAHYAALQIIHEETANPVTLSYKDAIRAVLTQNPANKAQELINRFVIEKIKMFECKFNGELYNVLKEVQLELKQEGKINYVQGL